MHVKMVFLLVAKTSNNDLVTDVKSSCTSCHFDVCEDPQVCKELRMNIIAVEKCNLYFD